MLAALAERISALAPHFHSCRSCTRRRRPSKAQEGLNGDAEYAREHIDAVVIEPFKTVSLPGLI